MPANDVLKLQRAAGNRAVGILLARRKQRKAPVVRPDRTKQTKVEPRKQTTPVAPAEPFTGAQLELMGLAAQVNVLYGDIEKLKNERIRTWQETVERGEPKPMRAALDLVVAMTALGMGGVFGLAISKAITQAHVKEFVFLAGLELVDKPAVDGYEHAMKAAAASLHAGTVAALEKRRENVEAALAGDKGDLVGVFTEAMRLQVRAETAAQQELLNLNAKVTYDAVSLRRRVAALTIIHRQLLTDPRVFHRELTQGYLSLIDESFVAPRAGRYGGDKARAWSEDESLHEVEIRRGNLLVLPERMTSLGKYGSPNLNFGSFHALATGVNTKTLMKLADTPVKDLPLTLAFRYWVADPFEGFFLGGGPVKVWFTRDPSGNVWLDPDLDESALEWLASYETGIGRELTDDERARHAPRGARKLYEATKDRPVVRLSNTDVF